MYVYVVWQVFIFVLCFFAVAVIVVPDYINAIPPASCRLTGICLHVNGTLSYVLPATISKSYPDLHSRPFSTCFSQYGFQNGV
jgi:hypothetical protein